MEQNKNINLNIKPIKINDLIKEDDKGKAKL